ncbi:uncharacterized protein PITG_03354 [Phytophthora infestans T30-4]|uniref:Uncharacterized protein n=1 Tax=Phytophthora infestans (strain T30-4) TaxID=403677 RepID=D0N015_PHYIT|nr:uncharacterized protein PITG_03354 [Phytophthora infestans T30-4]EEY65828.1 hypothetical protein PITG_03354 [Phytophthora infestans T30-4]|eukprot:XP_002906427.1 hypothetical protein PITG_03354 [Phytophthora infestans T30-4]
MRCPDPRRDRPPVMIKLVSMPSSSLSLSCFLFAALMSRLVGYEPLKLTPASCSRSRRISSASSVDSALFRSLYTWGLNRKDNPRDPIPSTKPVLAGPLA